jgi:coproporphyrinogen III oxidase-like Fe-S oxidoreductase
VAALSRGVLPEREEEELDGATDASERIMFGFRLREGVDLAGFCARWGEPARVLAPAWESTLRALTVAGHVRKSGRRWRPTRSGLDLADAIAREILAARGTQASGPDRIAWSTVTRSVCASTGLTT